MVAKMLECTKKKRICDMKSNSPIKIIILIGFIIAAVVAVILCRKVVTPPMNVEVRSLHIMSVERDIDALTENKTMSYNDSLYILLKDKIDVFYNEDFINSLEKEKLTESFILKYAPIFKGLCMKRFNSPNWGDKDFSEWRIRIAELQKIALSGGMRVAQGINGADLASIIRIMDDYKAAKRIAAVRSFTTVANANAAISSANNYANQTYIGRSDIAEALRKVKINIGNSHYNQLVVKARKLSRYASMTETEFKGIVNEVNNAFSEYDANKSIYGSSANDLSSLKRESGNYVSAANKYYSSAANKYYSEHFQPSIRVNLNSSWALTNSPNSFYKAYRSYSNLGQANSRATMFFDISGYSTFSFYIDSYAEGIYDYVMVGGLNQMPSEKSNYANTSGWQNPSTSFSYYKEVTFNNLDKSATYRIYVVYKKDGSTNVGDDRGYILLPDIAQ